MIHVNSEKGQTPGLQQSRQEHDVGGLRELDKCIFIYACVPPVSNNL